MRPLCLWEDCFLGGVIVSVIPLVKKVLTCGATPNWFHEPDGAIIAAGRAMGW
jgi:hypothetical protein